jgi:hypothetical protein
VSLLCSLHLQVSSKELAQELARHPVAKLYGGARDDSVGLTLRDGPARARALRFLKEVATREALALWVRIEGARDELLASSTGVCVVAENTLAVQNEDSDFVQRGVPPRTLKGGVAPLWESVPAKGLVESGRRVCVESSLYNWLLPVLSDVHPQVGDGELESWKVVGRDERSDVLHPLVLRDMTNALHGTPLATDIGALVAKNSASVEQPLLESKPYGAFGEEDCILAQAGLWKVLARDRTISFRPVLDPESEVGRFVLEVAELAASLPSGGQP